LHYLFKNNAIHCLEDILNKICISGGSGERVDLPFLVLVVAQKLLYDKVYFNFLLRIT